MYLYFCNHCCVIVAYRNEWNKMQHESACVVLRETSCHRIAAWKRSKHRISRISRFSARIKSAIPSIARDIVTLGFGGHGETELWTLRL